MSHRLGGLFATSFHPHCIFVCHSCEYQFLAMKANVFLNMFLLNSALILGLVWTSPKINPPSPIELLASLPGTSASAVSACTAATCPATTVAPTATVPPAKPPKPKGPSTKYTHRFQFGAKRCLVEDDGTNIKPSDSLEGQISGFGVLTTARKAYTEHHKAVASGKVAGRTILIRCVGGMGNCLNGLSTGLLIALLTNRAIFVDWNYPFKSCHINWNFNSAAESLKAQMASAKAYNYVDDCFDPTEVTRKLEKMTLKELDEFFSGPHVLLATNCPLYKHLASNPNLQPNLESLGLLRPQALALELPTTKEASTIAGPDVRFSPFTPSYLAHGSVLRTFVGVTPMLMTEINRMRESLPPGALLISMQIRMGGDLKGKTDPIFMPDHMIVDQFKCAESVAALLQAEYKRVSRKQKDAPVAYFLASDSERVIVQALQRFGTKLVLSNGVPWHGTSGQGLSKTLIDQWMMIISDAVVVTAGSTFGANAAMLNGRLPFYVTWNDRKCRITDMAVPPPRYQHTATAF